MQKGWDYMRKFDYSFLNNGLLPANLVNLTAHIFSEDHGRCTKRQIQTDFY